MTDGSPHALARRHVRPIFDVMDSEKPQLPRDFSSLSLQQAAEYLAARTLPPVDQWHPERSGDSHMEIMADGRWFHEGGEIKRPAMVQLFSTILRREPDASYVLVTPAERQTIIVHDLPFRAVEVKSEGQGKDRILVFRLNSDELVVADSDHPLSFGSDPEQPDPRLHVRGTIGNGLEARLDRALYYELAEMALADNDESRDMIPTIWSSGIAFRLGTE